MGEKINGFRDLRVWQSGHKLALYTYKITKSFPKDEQFALTNQMRRASISVTSNLAEGFGRNSHKDREHFYVMALGSLFELDNQYQVAFDLGYLEKSDWEKAANFIADTGKQLSALLKVHRAASKL